MIEMEEYTIIDPKMLRLCGILLIILGIISAIMTYRYVLPIGSISLIGGGLIFIFWKRFNKKVYNMIFSKDKKNMINKYGNNKELK